MLREDEGSGYILLDGQITRISSLKDKSLSITLHSQEIEKGRAGILMDLNQEHVAIMIKPYAKEFSLEEVNEIAEFNPERFDMSKDKSPSKRLRNVIWKRWQAEGCEGDSELYYIKTMEGLINGQKEFLI